MDYKVISPNEYYSGNGLLLNNGDAGAAAAGGLSVLASSVAASGYPQQTQSVISHATGAPYPYHADIYGYPQAAGGVTSRPHPLPSPLTIHPCPVDDAAWRKARRGHLLSSQSGLL